MFDNIRFIQCIIDLLKIPPGLQHQSPIGQGKTNFSQPYSQRACNYMGSWIKDYSLKRKIMRKCVNIVENTHCAVDKKCSQNDYSKQNRTCSSNYFQLAILVGEENHNREASNDDTLENKEDGPEDHVEADNTGGVVNTLVTTLGALQALEG